MSRRLKSIMGIYSITNIVNGKIIIGSSMSILDRWDAYKSALKHNRYMNKNIHLQRAWNKYGKNSFKFSVIEKCKRDKLEEREQYWIDYYDSMDENKGYNLRPAARNSSLTAKTRDKIRKTLLGRKRSPESIEKGRQSAIGHKVSQKTRKKIGDSNRGRRHIEAMKPIVQLDLGGNFINEFNCPRDAQKELGICSRSIGMCCRNEPHRNTAGGFKWKFKESWRAI